MHSFESSTAKPKDPKPITIQIDHAMFKVSKDSLTAEELRALPDPDIGPDRDLYLEVRGPGDDELIEAGERVRLKNGMHFFTAPAAITPGHAG